MSAAAHSPTLGSPADFAPSRAWSRNIRRVERAGGERTVERSAHYTTSAQAFPWAVNESGWPAELDPLIDATIIDHNRMREIGRPRPTPRIDAA